MFGAPRRSRGALLAAGGRADATLGEAVTGLDRGLSLGRRDNRGIVAAAVLDVGTAQARRPAALRRVAVQ